MVAGLGSFSHMLSDELMWRHFPSIGHPQEPKE
uniref:Uncharacterized protein n=1 Tax=Arundo donax TaxID=35708 RepID=A0A0A8Y7R0_ARUDO